MCTLWSSEEDLIEDLCNVTLPALLVFQRNGASFSEVELNLEPPASVKSISFKTGKDDPGFDPVCWKVEGFVTDETDEAGGRWKQLVFQDKPYLPPTRRETELCVVFDVERWRTETKAGSITLQSFLPVVQERLSFFTASLRSLLGSSDKYSIRPGIDTLLDSHVGNIPSLTQVIPCYNETVILSKKFLRDEDGTNTNLAFIISQFPDEWRFFCDRHSYSVKEHTCQAVPTNLTWPLHCLVMEVRMWASMRSQTVARTVVGAMQYQEVIAMLPSVQASRNPHKALEDCVELVLAHQTYGSKAGSEENDRAVRYLLAKYQDRSFYLVFDFDIDKTRSSITSAVQNFVKEKYRYDRPVRYASVLARLRADTKCSEEVPDSRLELIEVLPRRENYANTGGDLNEFWQFAIAVPVWTVQSSPTGELAELMQLCTEDRFTVGLEQMKSTEGRDRAFNVVVCFQACPVSVRKGEFAASWPVQLD
ncbi:3-beta-glucan synthase) (Protein CHORUS) (Protein GLUCAN SYNTHASE-LIKE 8) [Durusdinium trenchii]|uniref:3-beta-glucan synthase (Protein CHORUS (Protein GLUCAN SYNTHASE-LIKE 8 n=1 Tax=Durusdinium trenchii TaxID=1381693 RepID=A0ABP0JW77_9DINO